MENNLAYTTNDKQTENNFCRFEPLVGLPFYEDEYCQIYNCDSLTAMVALRPSRDEIIIVTDPPYGIKADSAAAKVSGNIVGGKTGFCKAPKTTYELTEWDNIRPSRIYFEMMIEISREQIIFGGNYFADLLPSSKGWIYWKKNTNGNFADGELAWTSFNKALTEYEHTWNGLLQQNMKEKEQRKHPTQKPLPLMIKILEDYTTPADIIVDPFMGSGTTLAAAKSLGRKAIGMEINKAYCEIAVKRLLTTQIRMTL